MSDSYHASPGTTAAGLPVPPALVPEHTLSPEKWGMLAFLLSEAAFFSTLIVAYVSFKGHDTVGPTPEVLSQKLALATTACLLASSATVHLATRSLGRGEVKRFGGWWALTIALGIAFLAGTGYEWYGLIFDDGLTISRNLFGTTFFTLVGFHALHVTVGVIAMSIVLVLTMRRRTRPAHGEGAELVSWYWHFVDAVWVVVFSVVYL